MNKKVKDKNHQKLLTKIEKNIEIYLRNRFLNYKAETNYMPFQKAIVGERYRGIYSFTHSVSTKLGMGVYEQTAKLIAQASGMTQVDTQYKIPFSITSETDQKIHQIWQSMKREKKENNTKIISNEIKNFSAKGDASEDDEDRVVDFTFRDKKNNLYFIDITSPKPNIKEFDALKLKLLRWIAIAHANYEFNDFKALLAMPYNPYYPHEYSRFSGVKMCDFENDIIVGSDFWDLVAGNKIYDDLIDIHNSIGIKLRTELEEIMAKFSND